MVRRQPSSLATEEQRPEVREMWREGMKWREVFSWNVALPPFFFGFLLSVWDVFSDYDYVDNWDISFLSRVRRMERKLDDTAQQKQSILSQISWANDFISEEYEAHLQMVFKNLSYFCICLPMLMLFLTTLHRCLREAFQLKMLAQI